MRKEGTRMLVHGFQKMTMLDFPGKVACTVFTPGCNMRCPFCHNARLVTHPTDEDIIPETEVFDYLEKRKKLLDGVCITGGEPCLRPDLADFLSRVKSFGLQVKLDTNGCFPQKLRELCERGLVDYVAMDIKNSPALYGRTVGVPDFDVAPVRESVSFLLEGSVEYEFRTTVVRELHTEESLLDAARFIRGARQYYLQSFVDSGDIIGEGFSPHSKEFMKQVQAKIAPFVQKVELRGI